VPELQIYEDNSAAYAQRMEEVFQKIHEEEPSSEDTENKSDNA
jgi:ribosome-binding factor A